MLNRPKLSVAPIPLQSPPVLPRAGVAGGCLNSWGSTLLAVFALVGPAATSIPAQELSELRQSVVKVVVESPWGSGHGTGFFVTSAGHVVTNRHVIDSSIEQLGSHDPEASAQLVNVKVFIESWDGTTERRHEVRKVLGYTCRDRSSCLDIVVLWPPENPDSQFRPEPLQVRERNPALGEEVVALGFPLDEGFLANPGSVTGSIRHDEFFGSEIFTVNVGSTFGNSGGPVVDREGRVIGVYVGGNSEQPTFNYAIPAKLIPPPERHVHGMVRQYEKPLWYYLIEGAVQRKIAASRSVRSGIAKLEGGDCEGAAGDFRQAVRTFPTQVSALRLGQAYVCARQFQLASQYFGYSISLATDRESNSVLAAIAALLGQARSLFELRLYRESADKTVMALELLTESSGVLRNHIDVDQWSAPLYKVLGRALLELRRYDDARREFEASLRANDQDPETHEWYIRVLNRLGDEEDLDEALERFERVFPQRARDIREELGL